MGSQTPNTFSAFSTLIVFLLCCLVGLSLAPLLSVQLLPSRSYASVTVSCQLYGASPQVTELELTSPIESALARLNGVKDVSSNSGNGYCTVSAGLDKWTDPELFRFEVAAQMRQLYRSLPSNASYPQVSLNRPDDNGLGGPLLGYTLNGSGTINEVAQTAENVLRPALSSLAGIYRLDIQGAVPQRMQLSTSTARLAQAGLRYEDLQSALSAGLGQSSLGVIRTQHGKQELFVESALQQAKELAQFPVSSRSGRIIRLGDVATISQGPAPATSYYRINGQEQVSLSIYPEAHTNNIRLAAKVKETLDAVQRQLPPGYRLSLSYDNTSYIKEELGKIYTRTTLSVAILLLFVLVLTRQLRYLLIVVASLAVNVLLSFILYYLFRLEIHLYSLAGITIAVGMIIDNVIVIVEDIRHTGRNRIFAAILASTLTALGALSVIFLLEESQRINLLDFALAIMVNLLVSLPVAYFFIPAMLEQWPVYIHSRKGRFKHKRWQQRLIRFYHRQLRFMVRYRIAFFALFILSFGLPLFLLPDKVEKDTAWARVYNRVIGSDTYQQYLKEPLSKYLGGALALFVRNQGMGNGDNGGTEEVSLHVNVSMPNGATLQQMDAVVREFEAYLRQFDRQLDVFTSQVSGPTWATISISFKKGYRTGFPYQLKQWLETRAIYSGSADFQVYGVGQGFNNAVNLDEYDSSLELRGYNYEQLNQLALLLRDSLLQYPRVQDVLISSEGRYGQKLTYEYVVGIRQPQQLSLRQLSRNAVAGVLHSVEERRQSLGSLKSPSGRGMDLDLLYNAGDQPGVWPLMRMPLQVNDSSSLRLQDVAGISQVKVAGGIRRENQEYLLNVHYRFIGTYMLNELVRQRIVSSVEKQLPVGYRIKDPQYYGWGNGEGNLSYLWFVPLVLFIIYLICAMLLESLTQPLAVILMIPFSFIGVFLTFWLLGLRFDQGAYAALLMLAGLVTNAALYIINDVNYYKKQGRDDDQRIRLYIRAFNAKAMPILVTTASAILSLLPFMINGEEKGFWFTLSAGTIGGLVFSLLGAYLLLPLCLVGKPKAKSIKKQKQT